MSSVGRKSCRICHASTDVDTLKQYGGRCRGCAAVKAASDAGMTYGKYQAQKYAAVLDAKYRKDQKEREIRQRMNMPRDTLCLNCGGIVPHIREGKDFCCRECQAEYEKKEHDAREREAVKPPKEQKPPHPPNYCRQCGKEIPRRNKYCNETCKYLFNQERTKKRQKELTKARAKERPAIFCRRCGKEIISVYRSAYCSDACANAAHIEQKRKNRKNKKEEKGNE